MIKVNGLENAFVSVQKQTRAATSWKSYETGKLEFQLREAGNYGNQRWLTKPATLIKKIKERIETVAYQKEQAIVSNTLKEDAVALVSNMFPEATTEAQSIYKSSYHGKGYYQDRIVVKFDSKMELEYGYRRTEGQVVVHLANTNFSILAAVNASNDLVGAAEVLKKLHKSLNK